MNEITVDIEVEVNPTEDLDKVKQAVGNIFGAVSFKIKPRTWGQLLIAQTSGTKGLTKLSNLLKREKILAASRKLFLSQMKEKVLDFYLNKQVAFAGHISFSQQTAESPLGPIHVQIHCSDPIKLINFLAPKPTKKSRKTSFH
jgi:predicted RNA binding protein with dsRBD fold (UPF0201 family)